MDHENSLAGQPPFVSYAMFVDRHGQLANHEVCENKHADNRSGFRKSESLIQESAPKLSKKQCKDLRKDAMFKLFLGNEEFKEEVAIPFHRAFWGHLTDINDLQLKTAPIIGSTLDSRKMEPDVVWQDPDNGSVFLTEMQRTFQPFYAQRIALYGGKTSAALAVKGSDWDYDQVPAYVLGLANFNLHRQGALDYIHEYASINVKDNGDFLTGKDWKILADLKKARNVRPEVYAERDKWIFLLNNFHNEHKLKNVPAFMQDGSFDKVIDIAKKVKREKMEELMDFISELHERDRVRAAKREGKREGKIEGKREGIIEGKRKGKIESLEDFLSANPNGFGLSCRKIAAIFKVDEHLVKSLMPA